MHVLRWLPICALLNIWAPSSNADLGWRSRDLTNAEHTRVSEVVVNAVMPYDEKLGKALLKRIQKGQIRVFRTQGLAAKLNGQAAQLTDPTTRRTLISPDFLSVQASRETYEQACKKGRALSCTLATQVFGETVPPSVARLLHSFFLGSMLLHEQVHVEQFSTAWGVAGNPLTGIFSGIHARITGENSIELEAYNRQLAYLSDVWTAFKQEELQIKRALQLQGKPAINHARLNTVRSVLAGLELLDQLFMKNRKAVTGL